MSPERWEALRTKTLTLEEWQRLSDDEARSLTAAQWWDCKPGADPVRHEGSETFDVELVEDVAA